MCRHHDLIKEVDDFVYRFQIKAGKDYGACPSRKCCKTPNYVACWISQLVAKKKHHGLFDVHHEVLDVNGNLFLQVDGSYKALHRKRIMRDPAGFPILTMREKRSHSIHMKTRLDVFLPSNINEDISNFLVVDSYPSQSSRVYKGDTVISEVNYNLSWKSFCQGTKEDVRIKVCPGVDYAFIVALVMILVESNMMLRAI
ncbi:LURP-one-related - like 1 [Theobroma cacao]|nr:LURP-one-related - like 1 [Theobroma cacao]